MTEFLQQFRFLQPLWLFALLMLPVFAALALWQRSRPSKLEGLVDAELLPYLVRGNPVSRGLPFTLLAIGWMLAALAFAGPSWNRVAQPLYASHAAQVVVLSLSQDMLSRDVAPSRLDRARLKAHDLLDSNRAGSNALIGYAGEAFVVAPLTSDAGSLIDLLNAMSPDTMPVDGNNAALAIQSGAALIHDANAAGGTLVVITDRSDSAANAAASTAAAEGVHVSVLGVGTIQGGPVPQASGEFLRDEQGGITLARRDDAALASLAAAGGGIYVPMTSDHSDIDALKGQLRTSHVEPASGQVGDEWQDRGPWLLLPLLLVAALGFRRGWLLLLALVMLPMLPGPVEAADWKSLWQRPDQQAAQILRQGGPASQAQLLARDPGWRGAADYRTGDYAAAAKTLASAPGTDAMYNRGNALAKQGAFTDAIKAYDEALKRDPTNADALANRKAVEDWLKQQKKPPGKKSPDKSSKEKSRKDQGSPSKDGSDPNDPTKSGDAKSPSKPGDRGQQQKPKSPPPADAKPSQDSGKPDKDGQSDPPKQPGKDADPSAKTDQDPAKDAGQPATLTPQQQAEQKASAAKAQQALQKQMDEAMGKPGTSTQDKPPPTHQLGALPADDAQSKLPTELRQALQRVPDDPGALLRRKFQLQYRQRHGGVPSEDDQP